MAVARFQSRPEIVRIDVGLELGKVVEGLLHRVGLQGSLVEVVHGLLVEVRAARRLDNGIEHRRFLPALSAQCQRGNARSLRLVQQCNQVVEGLRLRAADLVHHGLVDPQPIDRMDVHRNRNPLAVIHGELLQRSRNSLIPAFLLRRLGQIAHDAGLGVIEDGIAKHLRSGRIVAGGNHRLQRSHRSIAAAACDRNVLPGVAFLGQIAFQNLECSRLAARSPPMEHLDFLDVGRTGHTAGSAQCQHDHGSRCQKLAHRFPPSLQVWHGTIPAPVTHPSSGGVPFAG